jgi:hypothetical protein
MPKPPSRPTDPPEVAGPRRAAGPATAAETARYIGSITGELAALAKQAGLDVLAYLLDMARLEAEKQGKSNR